MNNEDWEFVNNCQLPIVNIPFRVFSLDTGGNRTGVVPATFSDGALRFTVSTVAPNGTGRIYYEIVGDNTVPEFQP